MDKRTLAFKLQRRDKIAREISELTDSTVASESISTPNGGSRSVSYTQLGNLTTELRKLEAEINEYKRSIYEGSGVGVNYARYC